MKALKYGLTLMLGLSMGLGVQAFAQASGQTQEVTPAKHDTLVEVSEDTTVMANMLIPREIIVSSEGPQRGIPTPEVVENLLRAKDYSKAIEEFENVVKNMQGNACNLLYLRASFYHRLMTEDARNIKIYQEKLDNSVKELESKCQKMSDLYILKARLDPDQNPETIIKWLNTAIELDSKYGTSFIMRGDAYWTLNQTEKACADYKKAAELKDQVGIMFYDQRCGAGQAAE